MMRLGALLLSLTVISTLAFAADYEEIRHYALAANSIVPDSEAHIEKNLAPLFRAEIPKQEYGSCHVYAATALIEGTCRALTGKFLNLSESYFFYRHLRNEITKVDLEDFPKSSFFDDVEGGSTYKTIERFISGSACLESEFQLSEKEVGAAFEDIPKFSVKLQLSLMPQYKNELIAAAHTAQDNSAMDSALDGLHQKYNKILASELGTKIDEKLNPKINGVIAADGAGKIIETKDPSVLECEQKLKNRIDSITAPTSDDITAVIDKGFPVLCRSEFDFLPGSFDNDENLSDIGAHALVIYGYRRSLITNKVEFFVRDSNYNYLRPYTVTGCESIYYYQK